MQDECRIAVKMCSKHLQPWKCIDVPINYQAEQKSNSCVLRRSRFRLLSRHRTNRHCHNCFEGRYTLLSCLVFSNIFSRTLRTWSVCHQMTIQKAWQQRCQKGSQLKRERRIRFCARLWREDLRVLILSIFHVNFIFPCDKYFCR